MIKNLFCIIIFLFCFYCLALAGQQKEQTEITGDSMTLKKAENTVVFNGNAKVVRGDKTIKADRMQSQAG